jgi:hypothetical protein
MTKMYFQSWLAKNLKTHVSVCMCSALFSNSVSNFFLNTYIFFTFTKASIDNESVGYEKVLKQFNPHKKSTYDVDVPEISRSFNPSFSYWTLILIRIPTIGM